MIQQLIHITNKPLLLPFYHLVSNKAPLFTKHLYKPKTIQQFKHDLDFFLKNYEPISLEKVIQYNQGKIQLNKPSFHLTFDDGLANFYHEVAPILIEKNVPATIFINTDFVDNKALFYRYKASLLTEYLDKQTRVKKQYLTKTGECINIKDITFKTKDLLNELAFIVGFDFNEFLKKEKPYLTLIQIKVLQKQGFTFGAHSQNHPMYTDISLEEQLSQTKGSLKWVKDNLQEQFAVFSFPFFDIGITKQFFKAIKPHVDLTFGTAGLKLDEINTNLQRLDMEKSSTNTKSFLLRWYVKYGLQMLLGKNKIRRN